jgi:hypothetical protein
VVHYLHYVSVRGTAMVVDEGDSAVVDAMRQAERYGEDPADFADQPRVSCRINVEQLNEYS